MGAAYGTAKSGVGIASMGVMRPELVMKSIIPVVMAGVLGIYGLIIAVIISTGGEHAGGSQGCRICGERRRRRAVAEGAAGLLLPPPAQQHGQGPCQRSAPCFLTACSLRSQDVPPGGRPGAGMRTVALAHLDRHHLLS